MRAYAAERLFQVAVVKVREAFAPGEEVDLIEVPLPLPLPQRGIDRILRSGRTVRKHVVDVVGGMKR